MSLDTIKSIKQCTLHCAVGVDARNETDVADLVQKIEDDIGPVEVLVFNIGANVRFSILDTTVRVYTKVGPTVYTSKARVH